MHVYSICMSVSAGGPACPLLGSNPHPAHSSQCIPRVDGPRAVVRPRVHPGSSDCIHLDRGSVIRHQEAGHLAGELMRTELAISTL